MLAARTFPGNPFDGHILSAVLEQAANLTQDLSVTIKQVVADLGFRGKAVDADNPGVQIIHRGRYKSLSKQEISEDHGNTEAPRPVAPGRPWALGFRWSSEPIR